MVESIFVEELEVSLRLVCVAVKCPAGVYLHVLVDDGGGRYECALGGCGSHTLDKSCAAFFRGKWQVS